MRAWVVLLGLAACQRPAPPPVAAARVSDDRVAESGFREMARDLWRLSFSASGRVSEIDQFLSRSREGFRFEARGPAERSDALGESLFGATAPEPREIDAVFRRHCRPTRKPAWSRSTEGYVRYVHRGVERRSGSDCVLITDIRDDGRWRFVLRISRGTPGRS